LRRAEKQLKTLGMTVVKQKVGLAVSDPDGNRIVFVKANPV